MKKLIILIFTLMVTAVSAQVAPGRYFVKFTDKNDSPFSISNPSEYLSQRAIERRNNQGISIDESDLPVNPQYIEGVEAAGAGILNPTKWLNGVTIYTEDPFVLDAINALPYVEGTLRAGFSGDQGDLFDKPFFENEIYNQPSPQSSLKSSESSQFDYGIGFNQISMLNGDQMHEMGYRGQGMVIAVLDAGLIDADIHPAFDSLWANNQILGTRDFVDGGEVTFQAHPHGTMVLGTMGAIYPGEIIGTAPLASYWLIRSEDGGSEYLIEEYNWVTAAEFADSVGADIINSSLGYTTFNDPGQNHTYDDMDGNTTPITRGADFAASKGILVVNSAGNEGSSSWFYLSAPSDGDSVMGVGAVDGNGNYASFSSRGPSADGRVKPNIAAQGSGIYTVDAFTGGFTFSGGTSFSSPIMAGMAACLWQANPELTNMEILSAIEQSASQYTAPDDLLGHGIPDIMMANNILTIIEDTDPVSSIRAYPNPFNDFINLEIEQGKKLNNWGRVEVTDLTGKIIIKRNLEEGSSTTTLETSNLSPGVYFLRISGDDKYLETIKILKK